MSQPQDQWNELGAVSLPSIKNIKSLPFNKPIPIENVEVKRTRFGDKVMLTCEGFAVFLPDRFNSLSRTALEHVALGDFKFVKLRGDGDNFTLKFYQE